ncbi:hypothetical protein B0H14DRAFT_1315628 [Mycena olivaceomarginata]|nr:hypothetical protein B0H14DRAFT_1315628 [Mycena olivaceomarginata]
MSPDLSPTAMEATMSTSAGTIRTIHARLSPTHSPFQSPPDSPSLSASGSSVSSFPSASSSFFFSSAAASPPHEPVPHPVEETLIIPSLTLPALLLSPKQLHGPLTRLLVLGPPDVATAALFVDNPDALDPNDWVYEDGFRVLRTSTEWRERTDGDSNDNDSNERWNIELVALGEDVHQLDIAAIEDRILAPFRSVAALLAPPLLSSAHEEELLTSLLMGHEVPLYTALLVVSPSLPSRSASTHPSSSNASLSASNSVALDSTPPSIAPPNSSSNVSVSNSAPDPPAPEMELDIPETLQRLVPVIVLVPNPEPTPSAAHLRRDPSRSRSRSPTNADTDLDMDMDMGMDLGADAAADPNDTTAALPASASGLGLDAPPTARLPTRPRHAARERTVTYPRATTTTADFTSTSTSLASPHTHTPSTLRGALRSPALRIPAPLATTVSTSICHHTTPPRRRPPSASPCPSSARRKPRCRLPCASRRRVLRRAYVQGGFVFVQRAHCSTVSPRSFLRLVACRSHPPHLLSFTYAHTPVDIAVLGPVL